MNTYTLILIVTAISALVFLYSAASLIQLHLVVNTLEEEDEQEAFNSRVTNYFMAFLISAVALAASVWYIA